MIQVPFKHTSSRRKVIRVEYGDLEQFINSHYGVEGYEIPDCEECGNDTIKEFSMVKNPLHPGDVARLQVFKDKNGKHTYMLCTLMQDMVNNDAIPAGEYL